MILGFILAGVAIILDQLTKFLIFGSTPVSIIGDVLWFQSTFNTGVAFSLFQNSRVLLIVISSVACIIFVWLILSKKFFNSKTEKACFGLILGGTLSNLIDRISFGGVRDFIYLKSINFAIFNVADMCVVCGVIIFCAYFLFKSFKKEKGSKDKND
jgi:signal peptidase II